MLPLGMVPELLQLGNPFLQKLGNIGALDQVSDTESKYCTVPNAAVVDLSCCWRRCKVYVAAAAGNGRLNCCSLVLRFYNNWVILAHQISRQGQNLTSLYSIKCGC
jgi:hypothetical protein